jgi:GAF domain-containing protein
MVNKAASEPERLPTTEEAALRRLATLVARESSAVEIFVAVTQEAARVLQCDAAGLLRFDPDGETGTLVAQSDTPWDPPPLGTAFPLDGENVVTQVFHTGRAARDDDWADASGAVAAMATVLGVRSAIASPVIVEGRLWGTIIAATAQDEPLPAAMESRIARFTELIAIAISNAEAHDRLGRLVEEQAALRRVAMLVAQQPSPEEIFVAVAEAVATLLGADMASMSIFSDDVAATVVASWSRMGPEVPVGTLLPLDNDGATARVFRSGAPARIDSYPERGAAEVATTFGVRSAIGAPVFVGGQLWGVLGVAVRGDDPLPDGAETRLAAFTELVATAVSNAQTSGDLQRLLEEQAALRRVATLVATGARPEEVFAAVAVEVGRLLPVNSSTMARYEPDATLITLASWAASGDPSPVGMSWPLEGTNVGWEVFRTGEAARIDDYLDATDPIGVAAREAGMKSAVGSPIVVEGQLWGVITARSTEAPLPADTVDRLSSFTELVATAIGNAEARDARARLADEQAALRRVATLVADGTGPEGVFAAVAAEVDTLFGADVSAIVRFEEGREATVLGDVGGPHMAGKRVTLDAGYVVDRVRETRHSARFDTDDPSAKDMPSIVRALGIRSAVASPIVVESEVWGAITAASVDEPLPAGAERRLSEFTELVATSVSNTQAHAAVRRGAEEQGALRRVATLVAAAAPSSEVFAAVTREVALVLGANASLLARADPDLDGAVIVGAWSDDNPGPTGVRLPRGGTNVTTIVLETGRPGRVDNLEDEATGEAADVGLAHGVRSAVGAPILVEGRLWGLVVVGATGAEPLPRDAEERLAAFTELVATAISNTESSQALERVAAEQAALRRVATLVAAEASQIEVFNAVAEGVAGVLGEELRLVRFEGDVAVVVAGSEGPHIDVLPVGTRLPVGGNNALSHVFRTGEATRIDEYASATGPIAKAVQAKGLRSIVATPIVVEGRTWGAMIVGTFGKEPVPPGTEGRLGQFAELMATGIANTEARNEIERLAEQETALRRLATLVAEGAEPERVFAAVTDLTAATFGAITAVMRFERDPPENVIVGVSKETNIPLGTRWPLAEGMTSTEVYRTGRSARLGAVDWEAQPGPVGDAGRRFGVTSQVACPIVVEGTLWGVITLNASEELPADTEERLEKFTELVTTAIANASGRAELVASRARIVAAGDEARRRIERNLHDGTQQRLLALGLDLQRARLAIPEGQRDTHIALETAERDLETILTDLRELSHGLHPPLLSRLGLGASLQALARRSPIPVHLEVELPERPSPALETATYYVVSEALTNAIKYSEASEILVTISGGEGRGLRASIVDDGVGGADPRNGSGLTGLFDRVDALGGSFAYESPADGGTSISVELPAGPGVGN